MYNTNAFLSSQFLLDKKPSLAIKYFIIALVFGFLISLAFIFFYKFHSYKYLYGQSVYEGGNNYVVVYLKDNDFVFLQKSTILVQNKKLEIIKYLKEYNFYKIYLTGIEGEDIVRIKLIGQKTTLFKIIKKGLIYATT